MEFLNALHLTQFAANRIFLTISIKMTGRNGVAQMSIQLLQNNVSFQVLGKV